MQNELSSEIEAMSPDSPYVFDDDDHGFCINTKDALDLMLCALDRQRQKYSGNVQTEYIEKQAATQLVRNMDWTRTNRKCISRALEEMTPADVAPVIHSEWVLGGYDDMYYICKKCGHKQSEYYSKPTAKYCPECGAKMDGKTDTP